MDWLIGKSVIRGEIDNRTRGMVTGKIWLYGRAEPLELSLRGNCLRDIAGCLMVFVNPQPEQGDDTNLASMQTGMVGDITASRKIQYIDDDKARGKSHGGNSIHGKTGNCIYMEWFSDVNGLVVLEGPDFHIVLGESTWSMSKKEEEEQAHSNFDAIEAWTNACQMDEEDEEGYIPLDEFEWERNLKESDAMTDRFAKALEKYLDHPDSDKLIAREMGWTWLTDALEEIEDDPVELCGVNENGFAPEDGDADPKPNPATEGKDWIRNANGRITHPLTDRSFKFAMEFWSYCKEKSLIGEHGDADVQDAIFQIQTLTAKLAGALDSLAYDIDMDGGLIVACLKRTLPLINTAIADMDSVERKGIMNPPDIAGFRCVLLEIREEVLRLMTRCRKTML